MSKNMQSKPAETTHRIRGFSLYTGRLLVAFLLGFVPMWLKSRERSSSLSEAERQLSLVRMENRLISAAIDARRRDYETARLAASDFFTFLRAETSKGVDSALSQAQIAGLEPVVAQRDEIITLLARGDAASADLLSDLYGSYRKLMNP
ncbi:MAG: hypothetical protein EHM56_04370 [Chloroflexi bacterium]|nr:MAG: hypothetical protein EHM56_04370 [Chloroflexota bacterium]